MNKNKKCPKCHSNMEEKDWEIVNELSNGDILLDSAIVYQCQNTHCNYMKRDEPLPEIIAQQGEDQLLLLYPNEQGRILDMTSKLLFPKSHYQSILARGYWEDYQGNHDVELLLQEARDSEAAYKKQPNLFAFATSELSQDAFLCWLLSWCEDVYRSVDKELHEAAVDFVSTIFHMHNIPVPTVEKVEITRQFQSLDVLAIINDTYAILIEDKTFTKNHSNQLERYKEAVATYYPTLIQLPIYFKIADQSNYHSVKSAGYLPFTRTEILEVLRRGKENGVTHAIYIDYLDYLEEIEQKVMGYKTMPVTVWGSFQWQGFYQALQQYIDGDWGYVANPKGGFWGFWWKPQLEKNYYFQLEEHVLRVKVKAKDVDDLKAFRNKAMDVVLEDARIRGLMLYKPSRLSVGKTMTIAQREGYIAVTEDGFVDIERTVLELRGYALN